MNDLEKIIDHAIVAYDLKLKVAMVVYQGTEDNCRLLIQHLSPKYPHINMVVLDKDQTPVYQMRVIRIHLTTILVWVAVVVAFIAWVVWG